MLCYVFRGVFFFRVLLRNNVLDVAKFHVAFHVVHQMIEIAEQMREVRQAVGALLALDKSREERFHLVVFFCGCAEHAQDPRVAHDGTDALHQVHVVGQGRELVEDAVVLLEVVVVDGILAQVRVEGPVEIKDEDFVGTRVPPILAVVDAFLLVQHDVVVVQVVVLQARSVQHFDGAGGLVHDGPEFSFVL